MKTKIYKIEGAESVFVGESEFVRGGAEESVLNVFPVKISEMIGFGGAFTESSAYNYSLLSDSDKRELLELLFGKCGLRYNLCRLHILP